MATQTLLIPVTTGLTLTAKLYATGVFGTVVQAASAVTEVEDDATDPTGVYAATFTDVPAGQYVLVPFLSGAALGSFEYTLTLATATFSPDGFADIKAQTDRLQFDGDGNVLANAVEGSSAFSVTVLPLSAGMVSRTRGTTIEVFTNETTTISVAVTDSAGDAVDLETLTLELVIEDLLTTDKSVIANGDIAKVTNTFSFAMPAIVTNAERNLVWSLRNTANDNVLAHGPLIVTYAPQADPS